MARNDIKNSSLLKTKFLIYAFNGRTNNSIHEFGMTKNVILARLHVGKRHSDRPVAI